MAMMSSMLRKKAMMPVGLFIIGLFLMVLPIDLVVCEYVEHKINGNNITVW